MPSRRRRRAPVNISRHREPAKLSLGRSDRPSVERFDCARPAAEAWGATTPWCAEARQKPKLLGVSLDLMSMGIDEGRATRCLGRSRTGEVRCVRVFRRLRANAVGCSGRSQGPESVDPRVGLAEASVRRAPATPIAGSSGPRGHDQRSRPKLDSSFVVPGDDVHRRYRPDLDLSAGAR